MSEMRERLAREIADFVGHHPWPVMAKHRADLRDKVRSGADYDLNEPTQSDCLEAADAVLDAMMEPTKGMIEAALSPLYIKNGDGWAEAAEHLEQDWQAMITAARNGS